MTNNPPLQTEIEEAFRELAFERVEGKIEDFNNTREWYIDDFANLWGKNTSALEPPWPLKNPSFFEDAILEPKKTSSLSKLEGNTHVNIYVYADSNDIEIPSENLHYDLEITGTGRQTPRIVRYMVAYSRSNILIEISADSPEAILDSISEISAILEPTEQITGGK